MKLSKIRKLCKEERVVYITDQTDTDTGEIVQYMGDAVSMYPVRDLPVMDESMALAVLDIPEDDRPKWNVRHNKEFPGWISTEDIGEDVELRRLQVGIEYNRSYMLYELGDTGRIVAVDKRYTDPLEGDFSLVWRFMDHTDKENMRARNAVIPGYIVAKHGFFFEAVWMTGELPDIVKSEIRKISERI